MIPATDPLTITIPLRTTTGLNEREHWAARARRVKNERCFVEGRLLVTVHHARRAALKRVLAGAGVVSIHLERVSPKAADDDNVVGGLKAVRDEIARWLGVDDGDQRLSWSYSQSRGPFLVKVTLISTKKAEKEHECRT